MKIQIIYSSLTGCTEKLAESIYESIDSDCKSICNIEKQDTVTDGDIILFGYWGNCGMPPEKLINIMKNTKGKAVGIFCTLGYYSDTSHAYDTVRNGLNLIKDNNDIIGSFICSGAISPELMTKRGKVPAEQKEIRWDIHKSHPTTAECSLCAERFKERIYLYRQCKEHNIKFQSIL